MESITLLVRIRRYTIIIDRDVQRKILLDDKYYYFLTSSISQTSLLKSAIVFGDNKTDRFMEIGRWIRVIFILDIAAPRYHHSSDKHFAHPDDGG